MKQNLTSDEKQEICSNIVKYGIDALEGVPRLHLKLIRDFANEKIQSSVGKVIAMMKVNAGYPYPEEYKNGNEAYYWFERDYQYRNSEYVLKIIDERLNQNNSNIIKTFPEFLLHSEKISLAEKIKDEFRTCKGKNIRLMLESLIEESLLTIESRQRKAMYKSMVQFFDWEIGSYQSIFDYKINIVADKIDIDSINTKIHYILEDIEKTDNKTY